MAETAKERFWREWAIDGMPKDKQRLAEAAWADATEAVRMNQPDTVQVPGEGWPLRYPAADALGAVRELQRYRMATDPEGDRGVYADDTGSWLKLRDVEAALALAQAPAVRATDELEATRRCALKYLGWLGIENPEKGLSQDVRDPEMCGEAALGQGKAS